MANVCENQHANLDGAFFCEVCGAALGETPAARAPALVCPRCGVPNAPGAAQCTQCGHEFAALAVPVGAARLIIVADGTILPLGQRETIVVGRADPVSQIFPDIDLTPFLGEKHGVSRVHLRLSWAQGRYRVEDQNSINHTFLNRQKLEPFTPMPLKSGDELKLGSMLLRYEIDKLSASPSAM